MLKLHNARFAVSVVLQVELHVDELLISAYTRIEAFRVSPVFNEAHFFIKRNRACVIRDNVELQLSISGFFGTFYACLGQCTPYAEPPEFLGDAYSKFRSVFCLVFVSDSVNSGGSGNFTVNDRNDFYLIAALGFCLEERALLFNGKTVFIGISEQIIRLGMC